MEKIQIMLQKEVIVKLLGADENKIFYSIDFLFQKKDGWSRPVINLKQLNKFIPCSPLSMEEILNECITAAHFKMEEIPILTYDLRECDEGGSKG